MIAITRDRAGTMSMGMEEVLTAPRAPWQNAFVERFIGSARRECFDHVIVFNEAGLYRLVTLYRSYYEQSRTCHHTAGTKMGDDLVRPEPEPHTIS